MTIQASPAQELIHFPRLLDDETLYSWSRRVHLRCGIPNPLITSHRLFANATAAFRHDFPSDLGALVARTEGALGTPNELALKHTLLGHFLVLVPEAEAIKILGGTEKSTSSIHTSRTVIASKWRGHHWLKFCQDCLVHDRQTFSHSIWHCSHQLPTAVTCHVHHTPLVLAWSPGPPASRHGWVTPDRGFRQAIPYTARNMAGHVVLRRLTEISLAFTAEGMSGLSEEELDLSLLKRIDELGCLTPAGNIRNRDLFFVIRKDFDTIRECFMNLGPCSTHITLDALFSSIARDKRIAGQPLRRVLAIALLFEDWTDFRTCYDRVARQGSSEKKIFVQSIRDGHMAAPPRGILWAEKFKPLYKNQRARPFFQQK